MLINCGTCCGGTGDITVTVYGCNSLTVSGATVDLYLGASLIDTSTTDGSGQHTFSGLSPGNYTITASKGARFTATTSSSITVTSGGTATSSITIAVATGYVCCNGCPEPIARTLYATIAGGSVTLSRPSGSAWSGSVTVVTDNCGFVGATHAVSLTLTCPSTVGGDWHLIASMGTSWTTGGGGGTVQVNGICGGYLFNDFASFDVTTTGCGPTLSLTFTAPSPWTYNTTTTTMPTILAPFSGSVPVTE